LPGADVDVATEPVALPPDDQAHFRVGLEPHQAVHDVGARLLELAAQTMLASSSKRALISTRTTTCLPASAARISERTIGESPDVR